MTTRYNAPAFRARRLGLRSASVGVLALCLGALAPAATLVPGAVFAQDLSHGADNFYRSDRVIVQPITFETQYGTTVAGNLFVPNDLDRSIGNPAIVVGHPMGATKEQSANLYATKMAEQGFVTVSLDLPYWGASEGEPRNAVAPELYAEAFSAAVDYLGRQDFVDRGRIGAIGICGSGSFVISAAKIDPRIRSIATVAMYDMGEVNRTGLGNSISVEQRREAIEAAIEQRWAEVDGAEVAVAGGTDLELTGETHPIQQEFYDFYRTPRGEFTPEGASDQRTTKPTVSSNVKFMNFYPFEDIETIARPMLFISGDQAHSREFSERAYELASEPKELVWVEGAGHVDLYDRVDLIPFDRLTSFFETNLADQEASLRP
ncbi:alpha/beta hydrolase [Aurantimonas coralicida]|uniref:alpha/beta hydrolase n=1 Tax=Aurantimonas coralicida TaxID=182270 RepID=UPI001E4386B2|nr:alpha/beta hydrolase [Aurantimonas coralicida]MCD1643742.1 alpha/beta hydrolase [Aurantimonas coralicida]